MSFAFEWPRFSDEFHKDAIQLLEGALNKGNKPPVIADRIEVVELEMGTQPPELEIRDIGDLTMNQFRGIFRLTYSGDAYIVLRTKVQANPLYHKKSDIHSMGGSRGMLAANQPLVVPMLLRLSNFKLNAYVVLVVSKPKGITLVFKTDPLQNVDISSTFDSIAVIQKFIQQEIEGQLRQMFREDLPSIIHRLSQRWVRSTTAMGTSVPKTNVEAPYLKQRPTFPNQPGSLQLETMSNPDLSRLPPASAWQPFLIHPRRRPGLNPRAVSLSARSVSNKSSFGDLRATATAAAASRSEMDYSNRFSSDYSMDELDGRPDFSALGRLHKPSRGLTDLIEDPELESLDDAVSDISVDADEAGSFDVVEWEDTVPDTSVIAEEEGTTPSRTVVVTEYETIPAVGGGYISRPRVLHSTSFHHTSNPASSVSSSSPQTRKSGLSGPSSVPGGRLGAPLRQGPPTRTQSFGGNDLYPSRSQYAESIPAHTQRQASPPSPPSLRSEPLPRRRSSVSRSQPSYSPFLAPQPDLLLDPNAGDLDITSTTQIVLQPGLNNTVTQLSLLNHANHTLSPYARTIEHFTIRSAPPRERNGITGNTIPGAGISGLSAGQERQPVKARRRRTYRLGNRTPSAADHTVQHASNLPDRPYSPTTPVSPPSSPPMPSTRLAPPPLSPPEFDESDIDRYFRPYDGQPQSSPQGGFGQTFRTGSPAPMAPAQSHFRNRTSHRSLRA